MWISASELWPSSTLGFKRKSGMSKPTKSERDEAEINLWVAKIEDGTAEKPAHPAISFLMSLFLPGTGQLLRGALPRAFLLFFVWCALWITHFSPWWIVPHVLGAIEAAWGSAQQRGFYRAAESRLYSPTVRLWPDLNRRSPP